MFDFDGTLSARDANFEFGKYCFRHSWRPWGFLPLIGAAFVAKTFNHGGIWWRQAMRRFLTADMVRELAPGFIKQHRIERFGWAADQVAAERAAGRRVVMISAGPDYLIPHMIDDMKFDAVICSEMEPANPWKYKSFRWGENKVTALDEWARKNKLTPNLVRAYSDSKTDLPIMRAAAEEVWIDPKTGCRTTPC